MKKFFSLLAVALLVVSVSFAFAADKPKPLPGAKKAAVNCCVKGKCSQVPTAAECTKAGGKVVKDCKTCK
ncbi:hypothetical protein ACFL2Q_10565 [Thermodesulfobacteriota bacterium]